MKNDKQTQQMREWTTRWKGSMCWMVRAPIMVAVAPIVLLYLIAKRIRPVHLIPVALVLILGFIIYVGVNNPIEADAYQIKHVIKLQGRGIPKVDEYIEACLADDGYISIYEHRYILSLYESEIQASNKKKATNILARKVREEQKLSK